MTLQEAIKERHAVRSYLDKPIPEDVLAELREEIDACNTEGNLHIQLVTNETRAFSGMTVPPFKGVANYLALVADASPDREEDCGYYGERIVLKAQMLGLNTCWVAMSASKRVVKENIQIDKKEKLYIVIAIGYGATQGVQHKSKTVEQVTEGSGDAPEWFREGVEAALLAPTALNHQKFTFVYKDGKVVANPGSGAYTKMDLGIAKCHFEIGSGQTDLFTQK